MNEDKRDIKQIGFYVCSAAFLGSLFLGFLSFGVGLIFLTFFKAIGVFIVASCVGLPIFFLLGVRLYAKELIALKKANQLS